MKILILHKDGKPVLPRTGKKQPKAYTDYKNAYIAIKNMLPSIGALSYQVTQEEYNEELSRYEIVEYVPVSK